MNSAFESTLARPIFGISRTSTQVPVETGVEQGESVGRAPALLAGRGAGEQQDPVRDLRGRRPHLAPVDDVAPAVAPGEGGDAAGVEPGVGLGHPEAADLLAGDERGKEARLLLPVPATTIGIGPKMLRWTAEAALIAPAESVTACIITAASASPSPLPPCSTGIAMPSQPPSATARRYSCGNAPSRSRASQYSSPKRAVTAAHALVD